jgi:hypothetical protein
MMIASRKSLYVKLSGFDTALRLHAGFAALPVSYGGPKFADNIWNLGATLCKYLVGLSERTGVDDFDWCNEAVGYLNSHSSEVHHFNGVEYLKQTKASTKEVAMALHTRRHLVARTRTVTIRWGQNDSRNPFW